MASSWGGQSWPPASLTPLSSRSSRLKAARAAFFVVVLLSGCARSPSSQTARFVSRGQSLMAKKDYARAILEFRNAAKLALKDAEPSYRLGQAYLDSGDYRAGVASLLHAVELDPEHAGAQLKIAEVTPGPGPRSLEARFGSWRRKDCEGFSQRGAGKPMSMRSPATKPRRSKSSLPGTRKTASSSPGSFELI